ncbi:ATP-binding SpoIIE family protein phosphatase [Tychonema sp. LEGE 07203]|uniref:ATP-binding SpoIIE family protein phosphatase n=1 Tax=Tychonema sp. LEGE 07203 TaxID=1828671 RepID=UPI0018810E78|nr:ATP-binding SpoIIE family protein phosphatase [Tychonema sp. LEGE 07203]MBE9096530.1 SpoIIE family protein phosphatase [Tychonema sp. LEGE 07203]
MINAVALPVTEESQVGEARRIAVALAAEVGFNETDRGKVAIVTTEAAKNAVKHAREGELLLQTLNTEAGYSMEIVALDRGPGMANLGQCLRDGFSTAGTPGTGLGAIKRLSSFFDIHSVPKLGTALLMRLEPTQNRLEASQNSNYLEFGVVSLPKAGEQICGDSWAAENHLDKNLILVADGLGYGVLAQEASQAAVRVFRENAKLAPKAILEKAHPALKNTRGAAAAIALIDRSQQKVCFAGVGNISGVVVTDNNSRSMVSYNGTAGHMMPKVAEFVYPWSPQSLLIMHSDGLAAQWNLNRYPGLTARHPALIAAVLYRDFKRTRDDMTVVVAKVRQPA